MQQAATLLPPEDRQKAQYIGLPVVPYEGLLFGLERTTQIRDELTELGQREWEEVGDDERIGVFEPDFTTAAAHEMQANIGTVTIRSVRTGKLLGYFVGVVGVPLKTKGSRVFNEVGVYILPEIRRGWMFKEFMRYVERVAALFQCDALIVSHRPEHSRIGKLYRRLGYAPLSHDYMKKLP